MTEGARTTTALARELCRRSPQSTQPQHPSRLYNRRVRTAAASISHALLPLSCAPLFAPCLVRQRTARRANFRAPHSSRALAHTSASKPIAPATSIPVAAVSPCILHHGEALGVCTRAAGRFFCRTGAAGGSAVPNDLHLQSLRNEVIA